MDALFALGIARQVTGSLPREAAQVLEALVTKHGFDHFLLGYLIDPVAMRLLHQSIAVSAAAVQRHPDQALAARSRVYSAFELKNGDIP